MDFDTARIRELLDQRDAIDDELAGIFRGIAAPGVRRTLKCSHCNQAGHTARSCPQKQNSTAGPEA